MTHKKLSRNAPCPCGSGKKYKHCCYGKGVEDDLGLGFESSGLAAAHAVHNGLTAAPATHAYFHGEKVAYGLLVQLVLEGQLRPILEQVLHFATEVGLPVTLAEIGLTDLPAELLQRVANRATAKGETIHNETFEVRPDMVADAIRAADALGRGWKKAHGQGENHA